ncbi:ATP-dependent helicase [Paenibacillus mesophilus]|uniref:ATP-dependent helicase n=1 Tax=Paenibacillus mesophilus TaxID=2582849 RepID=UPI00110E6273|nr:ATP-dependent helicase [Paenibacillus mesophilus]TMV45795.1 ATP-dependent helicase [Paenibacillus mesophilus]
MGVEDAFFVRKQEEAGVTLNAVQKQAVLRTNGALLLLASPGSGKTTTIIMRIGYLIEVKGVSPARVKAITFSRASANDMKERFKRFFPGYPDDCVAFSTIHSMAYEIMRDYFRKRRTAYRLIEGDIALGEVEGGEPNKLPLHKKLILRELYYRMAGSPITDDQLDELTTYISYIKNKLIPPQQWSQVKCDVPEAERILHEYETFKRTGSDKLLVDYDDMLVIGNEAMERDRELLTSYQRRYDYVLTDESQDTSLVQHAIIEKLVRAHGNLCVVADDDQSIYGWRAAEPQYLLDFKRYYPFAAILKMTQNYRSSRNIVDIANRFIKRNENRYDKTMFTANRPDKPIVLKSLSDYRFQAKYIAEKIAGIEQLREVAVLYRNNASSISLMNVFDRIGIPFYMKDGDNRFFSHWVVEDVLNFMRMAYTDKRVELFESIHTKCIGYVTKQQIAKVKELANNESVFDNLLRYAEPQEYQKKLLTEAKEAFRRLKGMPPLQAIRDIRGRLGYEKALEKLCERLGFRKEYLIGIVNTLEEIAEGLDTLEQFAARLKDLEASMRESKRNRNGNAVTLSTLHSAKGLEFERVYMVDLIEGILPSNDDAKKFESGDIASMEEAVRLFYVGMTRAKSHLELLTYRMRDGGQTKESRFVTHVRSLQSGPRPAPSGSKETGATDGDARKPPDASGAKRVKKVKAKADKEELNSEERLLLTRIRETGSAHHLKFGQGEVVHLDEKTIHIRFEAGVKKLLVTTCLKMGLLTPV